MENISNNDNNITTRKHHNSRDHQTNAKMKPIQSSTFVDTWKIDDFRERSKGILAASIDSPTFSHEFDHQSLVYKSKIYNLYTPDSMFMIVETSVNRIANTTNKLQCYIRKNNGEEFRLSCMPQSGCETFQHVTRPSIVTNKTFGLLQPNNDALIVIFKITVSRIEDYKLARDDKLSDDFRSLLESGSYSDVTIMVEGRSIKAHKCILACRSTVFAELFQREDCSDAVEIKNFKFNVVSELLRFCYSGTVGMVNGALLRASDEFDVAGLKILCENVLYPCLRFGNAAAMLIYADRYKAPNLRDKCVAFVAKNLKEVSKTPKFKFLSKSLLLDVVNAWADK